MERAANRRISTFAEFAPEADAERRGVRGRQWNWPIWQEIWKWFGARCLGVEMSPTPFLERLKPARRARAGPCPAPPTNSVACQGARSMVLLVVTHVSDEGGTTRELVVPLAQANGFTAVEIGGKGLNLSRMARAGLPVPGGFVITTRAYYLWLQSQGRAVALPQEQVPVPKQLEKELAPALQRRPADQQWAVRSSATAEDLTGASFAGQYDSSLNVQGTAHVLDAVRRCWISARNNRAVAYGQRWAPGKDAAMAVVVQEMVPAEVAGVIFTADPVSQDRSRMILEAAPGLGDALVSGRIAPDRVVLDKATLRILGREGEHTLASGLSQERIAQLGLLARATETLFGTPQDIEWALRGESLFLLQARPITTLRQEDSEEIWTNANVVEALPDVVTPMSWSLMDVLMTQFLIPLMKQIGVETESSAFLRLIAGRAYFNVRVVNELVHTGGGFVGVDFRTAFGGLQGAVERRRKPGTGAASRGGVMLRLGRRLGLGLWMLPGLFGRERVLERWGHCAFGTLACTPPETLTDEVLADHPRALLQAAIGGAGPRTWAAALWMAVAGVGGSTVFFKLMRLWAGDSDASMANRLLAGASAMRSAENGLALARLATWVRSCPALKEHLLRPCPFAQFSRTLASLDHGPEFLKRWEEFMREHGHQARGGMDVAQPRWREMPDFVLDMLRAYLRFDVDADPLSACARRQRERSALLVDLRRRIPNPLKRWFLTWLIGVSQRGLAQRENVKNAGVRLISILRQALLEAGRRLVKRGLLAEANDIFFLRLDELGPALDVEGRLEIRRLIAARKAEAARFRALAPPPVVTGRYDPVTRVAPFEVCDSVLRGLAVSPGIAEGKARVILQGDDVQRLEPGEVLVAPYTDPGWTPYFLAAAAVVVDIGGILSHGSVVAREYGLPAVVNVGVATQRIRTGQRLRVDGGAGTVTLLEATP